MKPFMFSTLLVIVASINVYAYSGGSGTQDHPYIISSVADWQQLMNTSSDWGQSFLLAADINLAGVSLTPVGNIIPPFTGVFDGNNHIISNAVINQSSGNYVGLFGFIDSSGQVKNLGVKNGTITGESFVGGLVGYNASGIICNCYSSVTVKGVVYVGSLVGYNPSGIISNCYSTGSVTGYGGDAGGLVGVNDSDGIISNCYSIPTGGVLGGCEDGGLVGANDGSIANCYSVGQVTSTQLGSGVLVGENDGSISNCYSTGQAFGSEDVGGLVGRNVGGNISNCYSTGSVNGGSGVGGLVGLNNGGSISNCYSTGQVNGSNTGGLVGAIYNGGSTVSSFWDINTSGLTTSYGGTGKTTAQMKTLSTFTSAGWDFTRSHPKTLRRRMMIQPS